MPLPAILMGLAQLAPAILPLFSKNETAQAAAEAVSTVAQQVTGAGSDEAALEALKADPQLLIQYQRAITDRSVSMYQEETKRLEIVNQSARIEASSNDWYVRRMRPTAGYVVTLSVFELTTAVAWTIFTSPADAPNVVAAAINMTPILVPALAVVGVYVFRRSTEKLAALTGNAAQGMKALGKLLGKGDA